jgi:predicted secreted protein
LAVRQEPGCETVKSVSVTPLTVINNGSADWLLQVTDPGDASVDETYHAASKVKDALAAQFELSDAL